LLLIAVPPHKSPTLSNVVHLCYEQGRGNLLVSFRCSLIFNLVRGRFYWSFIIIVLWTTRIHQITWSARVCQQM
jgi:hypothetical protein